VTYGPRISEIAKRWGITLQTGDRLRSAFVPADNELVLSPLIYRSARADSGGLSGVEYGIKSTP
jgi:hypothetical protein